MNTFVRGFARPVRGAVVLVGLALALAPSPARALSGWGEGSLAYTQAMQAHQTGGAAVAVYFYTDWCGYCKRFDRVLASGALDEGLRGLELVRINPETGSQERAIAERFGVRGYPSLFVLAPGSDSPLRVGHVAPAHGVAPDPAEVRAFVSALQQAAGTSGSTARQRQSSRSYVDETTMDQLEEDRSSGSGNADDYEWLDDPQGSELDYDP